MTENTADAVELRNWLVANLCTRLGCEADEIELDASLNDVGVGSRDALELSGELAELLGRPVSPVDFWQNPTINALVGFLTAPDSDTSADSAAASPVEARSTSRSRSSVSAVVFPADLGARGTLEVPLGAAMLDRRGPAERWQPFDDGSPEVGGRARPHHAMGLVPRRHRRVRRRVLRDLAARSSQDGSAAAAAA